MSNRSITTGDAIVHTDGRLRPSEIKLTVAADMLITSNAASFIARSSCTRRRRDFRGLHLHLPDEPDVHSSKIQARRSHAGYQFSVGLKVTTNIIRRSTINTTMSMKFNAIALNNPMAVTFISITMKLICCATVPLMCSRPFSAAKRNA